MISLLFVVSFSICVHGQSLDSLACLTSQGCSSIVGGGASSVADQIQQWSLFFGMERPNINVQYIPNTASETSAADLIGQACATMDRDGICSHNHTYAYDYAVFDYDPTTNPALKLNADRVVVTPLYSVAIVLATSVFPLNSGTQVYLSRDLVYRIFNFEITNWNHPDITEFNKPWNPTVKFPNATIRVVLRSDKSGLTKTMNQFMTSVNPSWNSHSLTWGANITGISSANVVSAQGAFASTNAVLQKSFSIGYVPLNYALTAGLSYALVQNKAGFVPLPTNTTGIQAAMENTLDEDNIHAEPADATGAGSYPLSLIAYVAMLKTATSDCDIRAMMFKFWKWCLEDVSARAHCDSAPGFAPLSLSVTARVVKHLSIATCSGHGSLAETFVESSSTPVRVTMTVFAVLLMIATVGVFVIMIWKRENRITKATGLIFSGVFLLGCFFIFMAVPLWALVPLTTQVCNGRTIFTIFGVSLVIIAVFTKIWSVYNIWTHMPKGETSHWEEVPRRQLGTYVALLLAFQVLLLILWFGTTKITSQVQVTDAIDVLAIHVCSPDSSIWKYIQTAFLCVFMLWSLYLAYKTSDFWTKHQLPNESQNILTSLINGLFWTGVLLPMTILLKSPETTYFLISIALIFPTAFALINVFLPKLFFIFDTNTSNSKIASFLAGNEQIAGYRAPASSIDCDELARSVQPETQTGRQRGMPDLPTVEEKEAKKDSPLVWYRQLDTSSPQCEADPMGAVVAQTESGRESPSNTNSGYFTRETSELPEASQHGVASSSLEMTRVAIAEE